MEATGRAELCNIRRTDRAFEAAVKRPDRAANVEPKGPLQFAKFWFAVLHFCLSFGPGSKSCFSRLKFVLI
jgi:hypothetical protein